MFTTVAPASITFRGQHFKHIEIVSDKNPASYAALLARHNQRPEGFLMIGNSLRSDVLPVLAIGGQAVHIPHEFTWALEQSAVDHDVPTLTRLADLPPWLDAHREAPE